MTTENRTQTPDYRAALQSALAQLDDPKRALDALELALDAPGAIHAMKRAAALGSRLCFIAAVLHDDEDGNARLSLFRQAYHWPTGPDAREALCRLIDEDLSKSDPGELPRAQPAPRRPLVAMPDEPESPEARPS